MPIPRLAAIPLMVAAFAAHADVVSPSDMQPEPAAAQRVRLGEVSAVIPTGCTPTENHFGDTTTLTCTWPSEGGVTRSFAMSRTVDADSDLFMLGEDMSARRRDAFVRDAIAAYIGGMTAISIEQGNVPPEITLPEGYTLREVSGGKLEPGPHGMHGSCEAIGYVGTKGTNEIYAIGLYCGALGREPKDLLIVSSMLLAEHPRTVKLDSRFTAEAERTAGNLTIDR